VLFVVMIHQIISINMFDLLAHLECLSNFQPAAAVALSSLDTTNGLFYSVLLLSLSLLSLELL
jgi:hypothetical protein